MNEKDPLWTAYILLGVFLAVAVASYVGVWLSS